MTRWSPEELPNRKAWHDAPPCPGCLATVASPALLSGRHGVDADYDLLYCPACGVDWTETDIGRLVRAWWSAGGWRGREQSVEKP